MKADSWCKLKLLTGKIAIIPGIILLSIYSARTV